MTEIAPDYRYDANPLVEEMLTVDAKLVTALLSTSTPPKLFGNGTSDVPAFTASGIDPQLLLQLPYGIRHAAAANPDITEVQNYFEQYIGHPDMQIDHPGLDAARSRFQTWLDTTPDPRSPEQLEQDSDALYRQFAAQLGFDPRTPEEQLAERLAAQQNVRDAERERTAALQWKGDQARAQQRAARGVR